MAKRSNIPGAAPASKRARTGVRLLRGVLAGLLAAALGLAGVCAMLPAQTAYDPARLYDYVCSGTKSRSQNDSVMFHRFQKSLISTAANGARKLRGVRIPKQ